MGMVSRLKGLSRIAKFNGFKDDLDKVREIGINHAIEQCRVDRCMTCHISYQDENYKDFKHPLKTHPDLDIHSETRYYGLQDFSRPPEKGKL